MASSGAAADAIGIMWTRIKTRESPDRVQVAHQVDWLSPVCSPPEFVAARRQQQLLNCV